MRNFLIYVPFLTQVAKIIYWMSITHKDDHFVKNNYMKKIYIKSFNFNHLPCDGVYYLIFKAKG
jgi:hypothetical protein